MSPRKGYSGAYRDKKDRIRPITPKKRSTAKTGVPLRMKAPPVRPTVALEPREREVDEERAKIALAHGVRLPPGDYTRIELRRQHAARTEAAQEMDDKLNARRAKTIDEWRRRPNKVDIIGIDRFPLQVQRDFVAHFPGQVAEMEAYYDTETNVTSYKLYADREEWGERVSRGVAGYYLPSDASIHLAPETAKVVSKGEIKSAEDYFVFHAIFHEVGHGIGPSGYKEIGDHVGAPAQFFGDGFDEGANEILSHRFTVDTIKMPRSLRQKLTRTEKFDHVFFEDASAYHNEQRVAADIALLAGRGDERAALGWMARLRYADTEPQAREAVNQLQREVDRAKENIAREQGRQSYTLANVQDYTALKLLHYEKRGGRSEQNVTEILLKANGYDNPIHGTSPRSRKYSYSSHIMKPEISRNPDGSLHVKSVPDPDHSERNLIAPWWLIV